MSALSTFYKAIVVIIIINNAKISDTVSH